MRFLRFCFSVALALVVLEAGGLVARVYKSSGRRGREMGGLRMGNSKPSSEGGLCAAATSAAETRRQRPASYWRDAEALAAAFRECEDAALRERVARATKILSDALRIFGSDAVYASFNGGKDAVVILHLLRAARAEANETRLQPRLVYFDTTDDFDEVRDFVHETCADVAADFLVENIERDVGFARGLTDIVDRTKPRPLAFVLGTRQGDPNCGEQQRFEPSSSWMPAFMRVNPILDWTYGDVWHFLRHFHLPYCSLYDRGYTSLGSKTTTLPNPALRLGDDLYRPAYELHDFSLERAGREESPKRKKPQHAP